MTTTAIFNARPSDAVAFGTVIDLALLRTGVIQAEVCEACSTINLGAPRFCKGCHHKLPAYYAADLEDSQATQPNLWHRWAQAWDLVAFWLVVNSLAGARALISRVTAQ